METEEAIKIWRDVFKLNLKPGFKRDVLSTVTDLELWKTILIEWKKKKWNPFKINWMLSEYERREKPGERSNAANERAGERKRVEEDLQAGVSKWRSGNLSCMPQDTGVRFRASSKTLEEIVTEALRTAHRSKAEVKP